MRCLSWQSIRYFQGISIQSAIPRPDAHEQKKKKKPIIKTVHGAPRKTRWRQVQIPSSAFFELCFCLYLSGTEKTQKQIIKERQNKTQNEDEIHLFERGFLYPHPHGNPFLGDSAQVRKWHASQVWINSKLFLHAAEDCSQNRRRGGCH